MVKMNMSDIDISEPLSDLLAPLNNEQREFLMNNYTIQTYKKNETIYCEGETPSHLMCLITGKVKIFKDGVGGRSQIIRMIKQREYFAYRAYFAKEDFVTAAKATGTAFLIFRYSASSVPEAPAGWHGTDQVHPHRSLHRGHPLSQRLWRLHRTSIYTPRPPACAVTAGSAG